MGRIINTPLLRFPNFTENWAITNVGELGKVIGGGTPSSKNQDYWDGDIPWISSSDLTTENIYDIKITRLITKDAISNSATKLIPEKSILIVSRVGVGKVAVNEQIICTSQDFSSIIPLKDDYVFLAYLIKIKTNKLLEFNQGTSIKGFVKSDLESLEISIPSIPEQEKIAAFLTAVDDKIQLLNKKKTLLKLYKKGVMQQIFNRQMRFKDDDGKDYPDWEEKFLEEVYSFKTTNSYSRENLNYENGVIKNIHYGDIHTKFKTLFDLDKEIVPCINSEIDTQKIATENYCVEGDLVMVDASEDYDGVGKCIELVHLNNQKVLAGLHTILARPDSKKVAIGFGGYLMQSENLRKQIQKIAQGSKVLSISSGRLSKLSFHLPALKEQAKIVALFSSIEDKINFVNQQITQTQQYKKGLLQQMFV